MHIWQWCTANKNGVGTHAKKQPIQNSFQLILSKTWKRGENAISHTINYLISQIFLLTYVTTFEPEAPAGHPKYQKTQIVA